MSELQIALLAIGLVVIIAAYTYGWWEQQQYKKKFGTTFKNNLQDPLYQEPALEPSFAKTPIAHPVVEQAIEAAVPELQQHAFKKVDVTPTASSEAAPAAHTADAAKTAEPIIKKAPAKADPSQLLSEHSDFIVNLELKEPSPASILEGFWQRKFDFEKPTFVYGMPLNSGEGKEKNWERVLAESPALYTRFRIALQMVDRAGAIHIAELSNFQDLIVGIAHKIDAKASHPDAHQACQYAVGLDTFCASVDQIVGINLVPSDERMLAVRRVAEVAALQGVSLESDGAFHFKNEQGRSLFTLINIDNSPFQHFTIDTAETHGLTLLLDVPRTESPTDTFDQMVELAQTLARELQLNLVDDHLVVLSNAGLNHIRNQIADVEYKMQHSTIQPGSAQARRLFV